MHMDLNAILQRGVDEASQTLLAFLTAVAGVGALSMALIQATKDLAPIRRWFQRRWLRTWLAARAKSAVESFGALDLRGPDARKAEQELVLLAAAGEGDALYDLPIEQLCGQLNAAIQVALDYPDRYPDAVGCLAATAHASDLRNLLRPPDKVRVARAELSPAEAAEVEAFVDARNRVNHQVQRAVDALQIAAGFRWKWTLQLAAVLLSGVIAAWAFAVYGQAGLGQGILVFFVVGILGGFLAPVTRDLVAALQSLRGRR
jgi:hypothetical protein